MVKVISVPHDSIETERLIHHRPSFTYEFKINSYKQHTLY